MAKLSILALAASVTLTGLAVPAAANASDASRSIAVSYGDLNLASVSGRDRLNSRVKFAVKDVCQSRPTHRQTLNEQAIAQKCEDAAMRDAQVKLAALFNGDGAKLADKGGIVVSAP